MMVTTLALTYLQVGDDAEARATAHRAAEAGDDPGLDALYTRVLAFTDDEAAQVASRASMLAKHSDASDAEGQRRRRPSRQTFNVVSSTNLATSFASGAYRGAYCDWKSHSSLRGLFSGKRKRRVAHLQRSQDRFIVRVCHPYGHRGAIRLGRCTAQNAKAVKGHIERMIESIELSMPLPPATTFWLSRIGDRLHDRLVRIQLCEPRGGRAVGITIAAMVDAYITRRVDLKPQSLKALGTTRNKLVAFFGSDRVVKTITVAEAHDFRRAVATALAPATTAKVTMIARQYFADAVNRELITKNPFVGIKPGSQRNPARQRFIPRQVIDRVIADMPSIHWRLVVAFARYGGLRIPSELLHLEWSDIDWGRKCILIRSPKTEHHVGHATRHIPLFPELVGLLEEARRSATGEASGLLFPRAMLKSGNLRTEFRRKLTTLAIEPWPKTFQNLRATRQTELTESFPAHVVCRWLGNSEKIAMQHYLQTTDAHFERAAQPLPVLVSALSSDVVARTDRVTVPSIALATPIGTVVCGSR